MSRRDSREKAFMLLYQMEFQKGNDEAQIVSFIEDREVAEQEIDYMSLLVRGVRGHIEDLDNRFTPYLKRWTKDRLPKVDLTILRLAVFEMFFVDEVPQSVAISEAVLLCKKYGSEESRAYINAVLGRLSGEAE